jgi:Zn2+/Cd2+-exporting ATPase
LKGVLEEIHAELLPADKVLVINDLKSSVGPTMMIGDGMNDAPALATADVGISMGVSGSAVATETSHISLMSNDLKKIPQAVRLARWTHQTILVNIILSIVTKTVVLVVAFAGHPLLWAAVLADVGTCLLVILHSMMLLRQKNAKVKKIGCCSWKKSSDSPCCKQIRETLC